MYPKVGSKFKPGDIIKYKYPGTKAAHLFPELKVKVIGIKPRKTGHHLYKLKVTKRMYDGSIRTRIESRALKNTDKIYELSLKGRLKNL
jgi:hypothetical protein